MRAGTACSTRAVVAALVAVLVCPGAARSAPPVWAPTLPTTTAPMQLSAFPNGTAYAFDGTGDLLWKSTDRGLTWQALAGPDGNGSIHLHFASATRGWEMDSSRVRTTTDGGLTWREVAPFPIRRGEWFNAYTLNISDDGRTVLVSGTIAPIRRCDSTGRDVVMISDDGGRHWTERVVPRPRGIGTRLPSMARMRDRKTFAYVGAESPSATSCSGAYDESAVYLTTDGGRRFRRIACPQPCSAIAFAGRRLVMGRWDGSTAYTDDGGRTVHEGPVLVSDVTAAAYDVSVYAGYVSIVTGFDFADARIGYAAAGEGAVWRTTDAGTTWTREIAPGRERAGGEVVVFDADHAVASSWYAVSTRSAESVSGSGVRRP